MGWFIGENGIKMWIGEGSLMERKVLWNVLRIKEVVMGMLELVGVGVMSDFVVVLFRKSVGF